ncbi:TetR/AcrR family transcriptional regulator C-terminal domain-containing protein [Rhodococcus opacus]|uniref:TetR/AcrR family transcriptional regulator C-terminal domain-containing protein n=1 Tax=Rhodococcus opacus TaxID=37919 RepID=UPI0034E069F9
MIYRHLGEGTTSRRTSSHSAVSRSRSPPGISRTTSPWFGRSTRRLPFPASRARRLAGGRTAPCQHALADAFARLDAAGLLRVDDPRRAAHHFAL